MAPTPSPSKKRSKNQTPISESKSIVYFNDNETEFDGVMRAARLPSFLSPKGKKLVLEAMKSSLPLDLESIKKQVLEDDNKDDCDLFTQDNDSPKQIAAVATKGQQKVDKKTDESPKKIQKRAGRKRIARRSNNQSKKKKGDSEIDGGSKQDSSSKDDSNDDEDKDVNNELEDVNPVDQKQYQRHCHSKTLLWHLHRPLCVLRSL